MGENIVNAIVGMQEEEALKTVKERLDAGEDPLKILESCRAGMTAVGERFEKGEYFLSELVFAGEMFKEIMELTLPKLKKKVKPVGTVVLGTVQGDIHDIGKNIFKALVEASGFEVIDLDVDVPPKRFVEAIRTHNPDIIGISGLITASIDSMKKTIDALKDAGVRDKVKVIIGGGRTDEINKQYTGADAWADDAAKGVRLCKELIGVKG